MSALAAPGRELDDLGPIGLAELDAAASLMARTDRKYVVASDSLPDLLERLARDVLVLEIDGLRAFDYVSDYHDTADLHCFLDTAHRRRRRFKVRTRRYAFTGASYLEVKTAAARGTVKRREPWRGDVLDERARRFVDDALARAGLGPAPLLRPLLRTAYRRSTFYLPRDGARVTIDSDLTWRSLLGDAGARLDGHLVVETKTDGRPCAADRALWSSGHRPIPLSKYATGMAALDSGLPRNRWHRLLTTAVAPARPVHS